MENIVDHLISYQQQFRILHWQTKSYARHKAYGEFYDSFGELMDEFIETHMGKYGRIKTGGKIEISHDVNAVKDASVLYTDVWLSMGDSESERSERINHRSFRSRRKTVTAS